MVILISTKQADSEHGFPHIKAMLKMENRGLKKIWFSTNTSSKRVAQIKKNSKVCLCYVLHGCGAIFIIVYQI
jgi:general stress protein 26